MPRIMAVLDLVFSRSGVDEELREHGAVAVREALDHLDARWWIEHRPLPIVRLVEELWWVTRDRALYRQALAQAESSRGGPGGPSRPGASVRRPDAAPAARLHRASPPARRPVPADEDDAGPEAPKPVRRVRPRTTE